MRPWAAFLGGLVCLYLNTEKRRRKPSSGSGVKKPGNDPRYSGSAGAGGHKESPRERVPGAAVVKMELHPVQYNRFFRVL